MPMILVLYVPPLLLPPQNYFLRHLRTGHLRTGLLFSGLDKAVILQVSVNSSVVGLQVFLLLG
jgi:hypothetical protein